ncbi:hypothetical protein D3C73_1079880 [compost metagenome]
MKLGATKPRREGVVGHGHKQRGGMLERTKQGPLDALVVGRIIEPQAGIDGDVALELAAVSGHRIQGQQAPEGVAHQQGRRGGAIAVLDEGAQLPGQVFHERWTAAGLGITGAGRRPIGQHQGVARGVVAHPVGVVHRDDDERRDRRIESGPQGLGDTRDLQQEFLPIEQIEHGKSLLRLLFIALWQIDAVLPRLPQQGRVVGEALGVMAHVGLGRRESDHGEQYRDESCHRVNRTKWVRIEDNRATGPCCHLGYSL